MAELYLLDTNILVHSIRQDPIGQYIKATYSPLMMNPRPLISIVTEGELRSLANQWDWGKQKKERLNFLLSYFGCVPIDASVLEAYAVIDAYSKRNGDRERAKRYLDCCYSLCHWFSSHHYR